MFDVCCRLCLESSPLSHVQSLYDKHKDFMIRDKIFELFQIKFSDTEKLSTVCNRCLQKIETANGIRNFFLESNDKFRKIVLGYEKNSVTPKVSTEEHVKEDSPKEVEEPPANEMDAANETKEVVKAEPRDYEPVEVELDELEVIPSDEQIDEHAELIEGAIDELSEHSSQDEISIYQADMVTTLVYNSLDGKSTDEEEISFANVSLSHEDQSDCDPTKSIQYEPTENIDLQSGDSVKPDIVSEKEDVEVDVSEETVFIGGLEGEEFSIVRIEYQCNVCPENFESTLDLVRHCNATHFEEYPHSCKHCLMVFKTTSEQQAHNCAERPRLFNCADCVESFPTIKELRTHTKNLHRPAAMPSIETNRKITIHKCDFCESFLPTNQALIEHSQQNHPAEFMIHACDRCDQTFGNAQSARVHSAAHDKKYECSYCAKVCPTAVSLAGHENTHTKEQPFECTECGRSFAQYTSMRRHMKIHFDEKAYQCDMCSKRFRQRSVMLTHRRIHTGEKPFNCEVCEKTFRDHSTLAKHKKTHQNVVGRRKSAKAK